MNLKTSPNIKIAFWLSLVATLLCPIFFPKWHFFYFVPYLVICFYHCSRLAVLWHSLLCGFILDLLSTNSIFGLSSLNYCFVSWLLYGQTKNFFADKISTLPLMTFLFSVLSTLLSFTFSFFLGNKYHLTGMWLATDLIIMPAVDAIYALLVFSLPFQVIYRLKRLVR